MQHRLSVLVHTPAHSGLSQPLSYLSDEALPLGQLVRVPLGARETLGVVWSSSEPEAHPEHALRPIVGALRELPPLGQDWRALIQFCAQYYQRSPGEVAWAALPQALRGLDLTQWTRRWARFERTPATAVAGTRPQGPALTPEQSEVLATLSQGVSPCLLFGSTGSGKTEVYLRACAEALSRDAQAQVLLMVPEINLTPQLEARVQARFAPWLGEHAVVSLHSGLSPAQRLQNWLAAHCGRARVVLGTRMAILASIPHLRLIVVDEEHDPSYKQQEGARYSARDLAVWRGQQRQAQVILGSATPSLESWHNSRSANAEGEAGRYHRLHMPTRVGSAAWPRVHLVDMNHQRRDAVLSEPVLQALEACIARDQQALVLLNRRGYAPVLHCGDCGWKSDCPHCTAFRVFHKRDRSLRCHHCGFASRVPRACPDCGNQDIHGLGRGTEQLEEHLGQWLQGLRRPNGEPLRLLRMDADNTRRKGELEAQLAQVHDGTVDVLVGTQMIAKGHDFRRIGMVVVLQADHALYASDYRAPERLFALLMQAAGRAGRDAQASTSGQGCDMWVQTHSPQHPLFEALQAHDFPRFAEGQLQERAASGLPPFMHQALLRAEARSQSAAQAFLQSAEAAAQAIGATEVQIYPPVPMAMARVANVERAQMLVESTSRRHLQQFLPRWLAALQQSREAQRGVLRWAIDVDPQSI